MSRFVQTVLAVFVLMVFFAFPGHALPEERSIKMIGVDDKNINLEIDGKKAQIPLPEGYIVADRELYAKLYERIEESSAKFDDIFLCLLVNSDDNKIRENNSSYVRYRHCIFTVYDFYRNKRFDEEKFGLEIERLKKEFPYILQKTNQELIKRGRSTFTEDLIIENKNVLSKRRIEDRASQGKDRVGYSETYFLMDSVVIMLDVYHEISSRHDIDRLKNETLSFITSIGK